MSLLLLSVHHRVHGLDAVERTHTHADALRAAMRATGHVRGEVELATCNRWELYLDVDAGRAGDVAHALARTLPLVGIELEDSPVHAVQTDALWHLFQVAAGLDSMVLGEREITGQLKRAQAAARAAGTLTVALDRSFTEALRAARRVQTNTGLAATGRSIVAVALDLAEVDPLRPALVVGTGAYAGAAVAALRSRGVADLWVHSVSGRGQEFAASHGMRVIDDLTPALGQAGVAVCCHGGGTVVTPDRLGDARPTLVDLALSHDVDPAVRALDGVRLIDLVDVQAAAPGLAAEELAAARQIIAAGVADLTDTLNDRRLAPAVARLQGLVANAVEDEIARLPGRDLTQEEASHALRRLAARLAHVPTVRARDAARGGNAEAYVDALAHLFGLDEIHLDDEAWEIDPARLDRDRCPFTGLAIDDLAPARASATRTD